MSHILQPSNVAFALIIAPTKPQSKPWLSCRRQWCHNVTSCMTRHRIFAPAYKLLIYLQCEWIFLFCGVLRKQIKVLGEIKNLFGQFQTVHRMCRVCNIYGRLGSASPSKNFTNPTYFYVRSGTDKISNNEIHIQNIWTLHMNHTRINFISMHTRVICMDYT